MCEVESADVDDPDQDILTVVVASALRLHPPRIARSFRDVVADQRLRTPQRLAWFDVGDGRIDQQVSHVPRGYLDHACVQLPARPLGITLDRLDGRLTDARRQIPIELDEEAEGDVLRRRLLRGLRRKGDHLRRRQNGRGPRTRGVDRSIALDFDRLAELTWRERLSGGGRGSRAIDRGLCQGYGRALLRPRLVDLVGTAQEDVELRRKPWIE